MGHGTNCLCTEHEKWLFTTLTPQPLYYYTRLSRQGNYPKKLTGGHTIVGCDVATCGLVAAFLEEFFHEDHGYNVMHLVSGS